MPMAPTDLGALLGVGIASGAAVFAAAKKWFTPSDKKLDRVIDGLGAGNGGPTIVSLVISTAERLQKIGNHLEAFHEEFKTHDQLEVIARANNAKEHEVLQDRLEDIEHDRSEVATKVKDVAGVLSAKTEQVARELHAKTLKETKTLIDAQTKTLSGKLRKKS